LTWSQWVKGVDKSRLRGYQILSSGLPELEEKGWILGTGTGIIDMKEVKTRGFDLGVWLKL